MKKIAICKSNVFSPNFKLDKIYYYEYDNGIYSIMDDFSILFKFDKKWQTPFQDFFNFKPKKALFDELFYELKECRKLKLEKLSRI
jgi:hypothetical protein